MYMATIVAKVEFTINLAYFSLMPAGAKHTFMLLFLFLFIVHKYFYLYLYYIYYQELMTKICS